MIPYMALYNPKGKDGLPLSLFDEETGNPLSLLFRGLFSLALLFEMRQYPVPLGLEFL